MAAPQTPISAQVKRCLELNIALADVVEHAPFALPDGLPLGLDDQKNRFAVWCGNIGAHRTGTSSLEHRLRDASHIRENVVSLLDELESLTNDAKAIITGEMTPWDQMPEDEEDGENDQGIDEDDDMPETEIEQIAMDIKEVVDSLLRLSITIRNPAPHDRFLMSDFTDTSHFEVFDIQHVRSKFGEASPWLSERLGRAISRRRQYFKYRQQHHDKLAYGLNGNDTEGRVAPSTMASSIPDNLKKGNQGLLDDDNNSDADWKSQTSFATSVGESEQLRVPPLPDEAEKGPFECPFCFMIVSITDTKTWKKHVFSDLRPYVCLESNCLNPDQEFGRRHEWLEHMRQNHWTRYTCPLGCPNASLTSATLCKAHLESVHPGQVQEHQVDALIKLHAEDKTDTIDFSCSLCNQTFTSLKLFRRHVGRHQEQLSLFALPSIDKDDGDDRHEEADNESVSVGTVESRTSLDQRVLRIENRVQELLGSLQDEAADDNSPSNNPNVLDSEERLQPASHVDFRSPTLQDSQEGNLSSPGRHPPTLSGQSHTQKDIDDNDRHMTYPGDTDSTPKHFDETSKQTQKQLDNIRVEGSEELHSQKYQADPDYAERSTNWNDRINSAVEGTSNHSQQDNNDSAHDRLNPKQTASSRQHEDTAVLENTKAELDSIKRRAKEETDWFSAPDEESHFKKELEQAKEELDEIRRRERKLEIERLEERLERIRLARQLDEPGAATEWQMKRDEEGNRIGVELHLRRLDQAMDQQTSQADRMTSSKKRDQAEQELDHYDQRVERKSSSESAQNLDESKETSKGKEELEAEVAEDIKRYKRREAERIAEEALQQNPTGDATAHSIRDESNASHSRSDSQPRGRMQHDGVSGHTWLGNTDWANSRQKIIDASVVGSSSSARRYGISERDDLSAMKERKEMEEEAIKVYQEHEAERIEAEANGKTRRGGEEEYSDERDLEALRRILTEDELVARREREELAREAVRKYKEQEAERILAEVKTHDGKGAGELMEELRRLQTEEGHAIQAELRKKSEADLRNNLENMRKAQEEVHERLLKAKEEAELVARERFEAERIAEEERGKQHDKAMQLAEEHLRSEFEVEMKAIKARRKMQEDARHLAEEAASVRLMDAIQAEAAAAEAPRLKVEADANWKVEADAGDIPGSVVEREVPIAKDGPSEGEGLRKKRPTYTRMSRRHVSLESLKAYNMQWDIDSDPQYVIIKRWVPEPEQDMLWRHTHEIRSKRAGTSNSPEYAWVRKKTSKRPHSPGLLVYGPRRQHADDALDDLEPS